MKKWMVETRAVVRRQYIVEAEDEKAAEAASCDTTCDHEEDDDEETMSITEVNDPALKTAKGTDQ